jgi:hypothetical protein
MFEDNNQSPNFKLQTVSIKKTKPLRNRPCVIPSEARESDFSLVASEIATSSRLNGTPRNDFCKGCILKFWNLFVICNLVIVYLSIGV